MKRQCPLLHEGITFMNEQETMHWLLRKTPTPWKQQRSSLCQPLGVDMDEQTLQPTAGLGPGHKGGFSVTYAFYNINKIEHKFQSITMMVDLGTFYFIIYMIYL